MKKVIALLVLISLFTTKSFAQNVVVPKKNVTNEISKNYHISEDSTLAKTSNGFDVKKSKIDNMVYLNTNERNPSNNKMPIAINNLPVEPMPVATLPTITNLSLKDTSFNITLNSDFFKRLKKSTITQQDKPNFQCW